MSYNLKRTGTVLRLSYARTQETPFNENLVLASQGCLNPGHQGRFPDSWAMQSGAVQPGISQRISCRDFSSRWGRHLVIDAEYITKYTHNGYDFSVLGATPITFPIEWHNSKIPGYTLAATLTEYKGVTARFTASSVAARFLQSADRWGRRDDRGSGWVSVPDRP